MWEHLPLIVVEVVMIFGGALAFGWWQLRDLDREKRLREHRQAAASGQGTEAMASKPASAPGPGQDTATPPHEGKPHAP